ncbi:ATP-dependent zinc metalloprotease FtsH 2 [Planctomycetales bacterium]|nr:ATP-dependent zinc metalloprotease FtsH 2 [Planctomycetales bacterium]
MSENENKEQEEQQEPSGLQKDVQILLEERKKEKKVRYSDEELGNLLRGAVASQKHKEEEQKDELTLEDESEKSSKKDVPPPLPDNQKPRPNKQPKQEGLGSNTAFVVIILASALLLMSLFNTGMQTNTELSFDKFLELLDQGPATENNPDPSITIEEGRDNSKKLVRYSRLDKISVGEYEIYATVTRQVLKTAKKNEPERPVGQFPISVGRKGFANDGGMLQRRLAQSGFSYKSVGLPSFWQENGIWFLMFAGFIAVMFFMIRGIGTGGAMAFGRSRGRFINQEEVGITFNDVAGVEEAVDELREIVEFLKTPQKFQALGGRIPRGVLLVGQPGTGKTILAKAVAGEAGVPFYSLSGSDFVELYVGIGASRVRDLFEQAKRRNPCIIFIDELDALGKARGSGPVGGHDEREQTLNALLVEMDGFTTNAGIIVMAATNRPEILDPALLRPGRFDRQVLVDRPDLAGREAILKVHIKNVKLDPTVDLKEIASITSGFVGADLAALVNEAALLAARAEKSAVTMVEFNEGVERVTTGLQKKQRVIRPDEKRRIAVHECGHALVAYFTPNSDPVHKVSIIPRGLAALGYTLQRPEDDRYLMTQRELESRIQTLLAGTIAEEMEFDAVSTGAQNDLERATDIARGMVMDFGMSSLGRVTFRDNPRGSFLGEGFPQPKQYSEATAREIDQEIRKIIDSLFDKTKEMLIDKRDILERLTERLLEKEIIEHDELEEVVGVKKTAETQAAEAETAAETETSESKS